VIKTMRLAEDPGAPTGGAGFFVLMTGGLSMALPAFAADSEALAMRASASGATGRGSGLARGGVELDLICGGFFLAAASGLGPAALDLEEAFFSGSVMTGLSSAGCGGREALGSSGLLSPGEDLAIGRE